MIRPAKYSDFEAIKKIFKEGFTEEYQQRGIDIVDRIGKWQQLYPVVKLLATFNKPYQHLFKSLASAIAKSTPNFDFNSSTVFWGFFGPRTIYLS